MTVDITQIKNLIFNACQTALLPVFHDIERQYKPDGSIVTQADIRMQEIIASQLLTAYPDFALLGEEMTRNQQQQLLGSGQALWCLDPIDGTSNFAAGLPFFCVSLALIEQGEVTLGIIYDPIREECFHAKKNQGAYLNDQRLLSASTDLSLHQAIAYIDFKRLPPDLARRLIAEKPYASQRSLGSIALELSWIAAGRGHLYLHGRQQLWDIAAARLILAEAGAQFCTLEGQPVHTFELQSQSTLAALDPRLFQQWAHYLAVSVP